MSRLVHYYTRYEGIRGGVRGMPSWAKMIVGIAAIPGAVLIALSFVAFFVSVLALLLLVLPVYTVIKALTGPVKHSSENPIREEMNSSPRRHVDVTIVE